MNRSADKGQLRGQWSGDTESGTCLALCIGLLGTQILCFWEPGQLLDPILELG